MIRAMAAAVQPGDLVACRRELADIAMVQSILSGLELRVLRAMREFSADAEGEHARATNSSSRKSARAKRRSDAAEAIPQLDEALSEGETTAEHVDVVADVLAGLSPADRARVAGMGDEIRAKATQVGESEFRRWLQMMVRRLRQDDAVARLARQKGACRANWWLDQEGMWNLRGRFDAETGARLQGRLRGATEVLAQGPLPEGAPDDPLERHQWLQAQALASLIDGDIETAGGPEMLMVIDAETVLKGEHERTVLDMLGFDLPLETIRRWACTSAITPVVVGLDGTRLIWVAPAAWRQRISEEPWRCCTEHAGVVTHRSIDVRSTTWTGGRRVGRPTSTRWRHFARDVITSPTRAGTGCCCTQIAASP